MYVPCAGVVAGGSGTPRAGVAEGRCTSGAGAHGPGPPYGGVLYGSARCWGSAGGRVSSPVPDSGETSRTSNSGLPLTDPRGLPPGGSVRP